MTIKIDLRNNVPQGLVAAPEARDCAYTTPCAVGALMTPEERQKLADDKKDSTAIGVLLASGEVSAPVDQHEDLRLLQNAYDAGHQDMLDAEIARLTTKYHD